MINTAALSILCAFMALGSSSILYISFKGNIDRSARFFLIAELMTIPYMSLSALSILVPSYAQPPLFFIHNLSIFVADISIIFSIYALEHPIQIKNYFLAILATIIYCGIIELCRISIDPNLPHLMASSIMGASAFGTYVACKACLDINLKNNQFLTWLKNIEISLVLFHLIRAVSYFTNEPMSARTPSITITLMYAVFISLIIFRYFSYQSLRISWVDPKTNDTNLLNVNLANIANEKEQLIQNLIISNRALGVSALANSLAHQISQPLTSIAIQADIIKRDLTESNSHPNTISSINTIILQLEMLADLVQNFRQLFSLSNPQFAETHLQKITDDLLEIIEPTLRSKNIQLEKVYTSHPIIWGNAIQIQQVLINLFNNAIEAIDEANSVQRTIKLNLSQNQQFAIIGLKDSGTGIDTELMPTLFDLYKSSKYEGLGIGLWLCKTIIDKHGGAILLTNPPEGGALFEIQLPLFYKNMP